MAPARGRVPTSPSSSRTAAFATWVPPRRFGSRRARNVIDATGKFVVPGIINAHGHVGENRDPQLRQYALYGVTTTTSMAIDPDDIAEFKDQQKRGDLRGARILTVKYRFSTLPVPGPAIKTPEAARAKVDEIVAKGADYIKVWVDGQEGKVPRADAGILRRRFRAGPQARQDHHGAHRRVRGREEDGRAGRRTSWCTTFATAPWTRISSPR